MATATPSAEKHDIKSARSSTSRSSVGFLDTFGYTVGDTLGTGAYATVKVAYSAKHKRKVAIKIVNTSKAPTEYVRKFLPRELEIVKILWHPNIIMVYEIIETEAKVYVIMELAARGDVMEAIHKLGHVPEAEAGKWFYQMVDGIDYCHKKGVVHRDLKCENLLLDKRNNIKISDFGFGKCHHVSGDLSQTYCGSFYYACPEILRTVPYDPRKADVWSLGIILYTMLYGRLPYDDPNVKILMVQTSRTPFFALQPEISLGAKMCILKMLVPEAQRVTIPALRSSDPWFQSFDLGPQPESSSIVYVEASAPRSTTPPLPSSSQQDRKESSKKPTQIKESLSETKISTKKLSNTNIISRQ